MSQQLNNQNLNNISTDLNTSSSLIVDRSQIKTGGADIQTINKVFTEVQDMMKGSPSQQQLSNSPQLIPGSSKYSQQQQKQQTQLYTQPLQKSQMDYERSSPQLKINSINGGQYSSSINQILLDKETQNQKLRDMNSLLKDKIAKLSQALDISLANQRQLQLQQQQQNSSINSSSLPGGQLSQLTISQPPPAREALQNHLKLKDREIQSYANIINSLKKQNEQLKSKLEHKEGFTRVLELEDKLREAEKRNSELIKEVKSLQRIQSDQGKALEKIVNEGDYPNKIKHLMDEIRQLKDKIKGLEDKSRRNDKNSMQVQDYLIKLEESNRELKAKNKALQSGIATKDSQFNHEKSVILGNNGSSDTYPNTENSIILSGNPNQNNIKDSNTNPITNQNNGGGGGGVVAFSENHQLEELQRVNGILNRAKEVLFKKTQYLKTKIEKRTAKYQQKIETLNNKIAEQDKEIKLYQLKLKDLVKNNLNTISSQAYLEIEGMIQPKPIQNQNNKMVDQYNKMREISEKYSKLPLKPGFQGGRQNPIRLNHLSIDVNSNDYGGNTNNINNMNLKSDLYQIGGSNENISNRSLNQSAIKQSTINSYSSGLKSVQNRSKSIDPTSKKLAKIPETTTRKGGPHNGKIQLNSLFEGSGSDIQESQQLQQQQLILKDSRNLINSTYNNSVDMDINQIQNDLNITADAYIISPASENKPQSQASAYKQQHSLHKQQQQQHNHQQNKSYLDQFDQQQNSIDNDSQQIPAAAADRKIRDLDKETDELLARFQAQNQSYIQQNDQIIDKGLNNILSQLQDGDISKINQDMLDDDNFNSYN